MLDTTIPPSPKNAIEKLIQIINNFIKIIINQTSHPNTLTTTPAQFIHLSFLFFLPFLNLVNPQRNPESSHAGSPKTNKEEPENPSSRRMLPEEGSLLKG